MSIFCYQEMYVQGLKGGAFSIHPYTLCLIVKGLGMQIESVVGKYCFEIGIQQSQMVF